MMLSLFVLSAANISLVGVVFRPICRRHIAQLLPMETEALLVNSPVAVAVSTEMNNNTSRLMMLSMIVLSAANISLVGVVFRPICRRHIGKLLPMETEALPVNSAVAVAVSTEMNNKTSRLMTLSMIILSAANISLVGVVFRPICRRHIAKLLPMETEALLVNSPVAVAVSTERSNKTSRLMMLSMIVLSAANTCLVSVVFRPIFRKLIAKLLPMETEALLVNSLVAVAVSTKRSNKTSRSLMYSFIVLSVQNTFLVCVVFKAIYRRHIVQLLPMEIAALMINSSVTVAVSTVKNNNTS